MTRDQFKKELKKELKKHRWNYREVWDTVCACGDSSVAVTNFYEHQVDMVMPIIDRYAPRRDHVDTAGATSVRVDVAGVDGLRRAIWGGSGGMP